MSKQTEITKCLECGEFKDANEVDECGECGECVCFECGTYEKHLALCQEERAQDEE